MVIKAVEAYAARPGRNDDHPGASRDRPPKWGRDSGPSRGNRFDVAARAYLTYGVIYWIGASISPRTESASAANE